MKKMIMIIILIVILGVSFFIFYLNGAESIMISFYEKRNLLAVPGLESHYSAHPPPAITIGCLTSGACNYDQNAAIKGKCAFANFAQVAPPARTATSTRPTPYWIVSYRIENADNSILTSGSYRYFPPPNFTPTLGANACSVRIGGQSFGDWLQRLIPAGQ